MTSDRRDKRLVHQRDESPEVRALLEVGITDEAFDYDFEGGLHAHLGAIGALPPAPSEPASSPDATGALPGAKTAASSKAALAWVGASVATVGVAAALWLAGHASSTGASGARPGELAPPSAIAASPAGQSGGLALPREPEHAGAARNEPAPMPHAAPASSARHREIGHADGSPVRAAPGASAPFRVTLTESGEEPRVVAERAAPPSETALAPSASSSGSADDLSEAASDARAEQARRNAELLRHDMDLLADAKRALATDPARALTLARQGEAEIPRSLFAEERRHVLLLALIALGRTSEAQRIAAPYLKQHPDSPFARRVQSALDGASAR